MSLTHIRWNIHRDLPAIMEIHRRSFTEPMTEEEILAHLRKREGIGMVAEIGDTIVGHMLYDLWKRKFHLVTLAVHPGYRRMGIGTEMVEKLRGKLSDQYRSHLTIDVHEDNLAAQLFLRECGLRATTVRRGFYGPGEDGYVMRLDHRERCVV